MKGRVIALGQTGGRVAAALIIDGVVEDLLIDPAGGAAAPAPGTIYRAVAGRPVKGQGGMFLRLPEGTAFLRGARASGEGQSLLVQVTTVPEPSKAVPVTDRVLFKGRAAIITPHALGLNISRRIRDDDNRVRLHDIATQALGSHDWGVILRSAAADLGDGEVAVELAELVELAARVMGDLGSEPELLVDGVGAHALAWREWSVPTPDAIEDDTGAFEALGVHDAIASARSPRVDLGAAFMFVQATRALVAIDVNTGADHSPAAALKANLAAARALPRALRLRGLGGQITIDFAPLPKRDRRQIEAALRRAFRADPVETALVGWTPLGHFELQRKRERFPI